jgi:glycerol-3-phosphate O-acyltransferase/dihydroxyacetone phosphate acyltransferase
VFKNVEEVLGEGGSIAIFPEGGSHDQSDLLPFKAGIALMTFGTIMRTGQVPVIIPSGLKYFKRHEFRSRCILEFGRPYKPTKKMVDLYKNGEKRKAVALMLKDLEDRMREVTLLAPSYNELQAIYMARNLYLPKNISGFTAEQENEIYQRFAKGYNAMKDKPELQQLVEAISNYRTMLKLFNITDEQVRYFNQSFLLQVALMIVSLIRLCFSLIFALPGNIITFPLSIAIAYYAETERIKALKGSNVKIKANDVLASIKIVAYISTFPIYLVIFTMLSYYKLQSYFGLSQAEARYYSTILFFLYPVISVISIRSHDGVRTHYYEFQGRFLSLFYVSQVDVIKKTRRKLRNTVREVVDKVGPQVFKNFDKMRNIMFDPKGKARVNKAKDDLQRVGSRQDPTGSNVLEMPY